jgi:AraC family transcriptional regulator, regulatory protein of adaptative response / methylated-DNA-[protein]-cysteine methyltransferase
MTMDTLAVRPDRPSSEISGESASLAIRHDIAPCWLGSVLVATTHKGICAILLGNDAGSLLGDLKRRFAGAPLIGGGEAVRRLTATVVAFVESPGQGLDLPLDARGTSFQERVWRALREVPPGSTTSYSDVAEHIGAPEEAYAVGEACAANAIAVAIPCHRVVRKDGGLAGYRWGLWRKRALLKREGAR